MLGKWASLLQCSGKQFVKTHVLLELQSPTVLPGGSLVVHATVSKQRLALLAADSSCASSATSSSANAILTQST